MKKFFLTFSIVLASMLSACGGGNGSASASATSGPIALQTTDTVNGTGSTAVAGNTLTVNYTGWLYDASAAQNHGKQFDSSIGKAPFSFKLGAGQVIAGWDQGMVGMKVGGKRTLIIPSAMGYGSSGAGGVIPPNTALVFDVELISIP
ncbi:MAG: FK506-binding protein [Pseudomonadota bacterium]|jgi:FKBP-type peptidyl-prolyl cis-trans isomerase FkpA